MDAVALESLKSDAGFMKDPKRARDLLMALDGEQHLQQQISEKVLAENVLIALVLVNRMRHSGRP